MDQAKGAATAVVAAAAGLVVTLIMMIAVLFGASDDDECLPGAGGNGAPAAQGSGSAAIPSAEGTVKPMKAGTFQLTSPFGPRGGEMHKGQDLAGPAGTPIYAFADGVVRYSGTATGFGHWIVIDHNIKGQRVSTVYGHMYADGLIAKQGETVKAGQLIAKEGSDGQSSGPHLHFEVHPGGYKDSSTAVDPAPWLAAAGEPGGLPAAAPAGPTAQLAQPDPAPAQQPNAPPAPAQVGAQAGTGAGTFSKDTGPGQVDRTGGINGGFVTLGNISGQGVTTAGQQHAWDLVRTKFPDATLISATRTVQVLGRPDNHNRGLAIDLGGDVAKLPAIANWIADTFPDSQELILSPFSRNIHGGKPFQYDASTLADHRDHVHWTAPARVLNGNGGSLTPPDSSAGAGTCTPGGGGDTVGGGVDNLAAGKVPPEFEPWFRRAGTTCPQISSALLAGDTKQESGFNRLAVSSSGAQGSAQFMPGTWPAYGRDDDGNGRVSPFDIGDATMAQARYFCAIAKQIDGWIAAGTVKPDATGPVGLYIAAYNAGEGAIQRAGGMPSGGDYTTQTRPYVQRVLAYAREFAGQGFDGRGL